MLSVDALKLVGSLQLISNAVMQTIGSSLMWSLAAFVLVALLVDFFAMSKQGAHRVSTREAAIWSLVWVGVSLLFMGWLWWYLGGAGTDEAARSPTPNRWSS